MATKKIEVKKEVIEGSEISDHMTGKMTMVESTIIPQPVLCTECRLYQSDVYNKLDLCNSGKAPYTDFIKGLKECYQLNSNGNCQYHRPTWQEIPEPEVIKPGEEANG